METRKAFARNLRNAMKAQGYKTVERFAYENGYSKSWLGKILAGAVEPGFYKVIKLARSLDVTLDELYPMRRKRK